MIKRLSNVNLLNSIACIGYLLLVFAYYGANELLGHTLGGYTWVITFFVYPLLLYKVTFTKYNKRELCIGSILVVLCLITTVYTEQTSLFTNLLVLLSLKNIDIKLLLKRCFWFALTAYIMVIVLSLFGIGGPLSLTKNFGRGRVETRYCLGYGHPNGLHCYLFLILCLYIYAYFDKIKIWQIVIAAVINISMFWLTASRTGVAAISLLLVLYLFVRYCSSIATSKIWMIGTIAGYLGIVVISVCAVIWNFNPVFAWLNKLLTGRIDLAHNYLFEYSVGLFGSKIPDGFYLDHGWIGVLMFWGIVWFIIYQVAMLVLLYTSNKHGELAVVIIILISALYGIAEFSVLEKVFRNLMFIFMSGVLYSKTVAGQRID
ncbi:hypothetical protein [Lachnotalea sp. AF33-28]|uniref:hypothetical protein n=1 Tax=Lachnotalea sp. AF33-28 TaxID=2292046 RepID=UPI000E506D84|nr:hypothetical protein [Lachnotalea sp. AF33-28]RHP34974.1 hypothetical protein DWZ56_05540 [Lachnotalea sp. AF33-28]